MRDRVKLREAIERERKILNFLADQYGLLDKRTLQKSEQLDLLLNEYNRLTWGKAEVYKKPIA